MSGQQTSDFDCNELNLDDLERIAGGDLSEMGEMQSLRLQMAMDRLSKFMSTLSNILKAESRTASAIVANLK